MLEPTVAYLEQLLRRAAGAMRLRPLRAGFISILALAGGPFALAQSAPHSVILHAARLLDIETGRILTPGEVLITGENIVASDAQYGEAGMPPMTRQSRLAQPYSNDIVLAPMHAGVGLRLGANVGYLSYSRRRNWIPF